MNQGVPRQAQRDLTALTGLRFVAAIVVVLFHFSRVPIPDWASPVRNVIDSGYVGVSLFFLLSGFIMSFSYLSTAGGDLRGTKRAFWASRFARIAPAYLLAFLLAAPTDIALSLHLNGVRTGMLKLGVNAFAYLTFLQAWSPLTAWAWNFPAWSVSVEVFFYAIFPWLGPWLARRASRRVKIAGWFWFLSLLAPLSLFLLKGPTGPPQVGDHLQMAVEFTPLLRLPEFALGILLGNAFVAGRFDRLSGAWLSSLAAFAVLLATAFSPYIPHPLAAGFVFTPLFAALIVSLGLGKGPIAAVLSSRPFILLGEASYGIYILQIPVSYVLRCPPPHTRMLVLVGYCFALVLGALLSFRYVETPLRLFLRKLLSGPPAAIASGATPAGPTGCEVSNEASSAEALSSSAQAALSPSEANRRRFLFTGVSAAGVASAYIALRKVRAARPGRLLRPEQVRWVSTTEDTPWQTHRVPGGDTWLPGHAFVVELDAPAQKIDGFGGCFNEMGWEALAALPPKDRDSILRDLFAPGAGANFTLCRTPLGANDFSRGWYSYDETADDFSLQRFSITNDLGTLIPFIRAAKQHNADLRLWASPWSPPSWMKKNNFYAEQAQSSDQPSNGIRSDQIAPNGTDIFRSEERYFAAYAHYFAKYIDAYREQGIAVGMVMPQNEFSSAQPFPCCTWSPESLARLVQHLGPRMGERGVDIFLGTLEVGNPALFEPALRAHASSQYIRGFGVQWAGKSALPALHAAYPDLQIYQSEQECGDGKNDWRHCLHCWDLMKFYLENGANAYMYWNLALFEGGASHWGWKQNSLITVAADGHKYQLNHEYYLMKHFSHFVQPGARRLRVQAHWTEGLAFQNGDGSIVVVMRNPVNFKEPVSIQVGGARIAVWLNANSLNTFVIGREALQGGRLA